MLTKCQANNLTSWKIKSQSDLCYKIAESVSIFSPGNSLLLFGGKKTRRCVILDKKLYRNYAALIKNYFNEMKTDCFILPIKATEKNKNTKNLFKIYKSLDKFGLRRRSEPVIIIGGGVILDTAGFALGSYRRGVPYIRVPTTLMAYIDVAIGIKTSINFNGHKNRVGSFSAPLLSILDRSFFKSLPKRHIINGIAEIIKMAIIKDAPLFHLIEQEISVCIADKFLNTGNAILTKAVHGMLEELTPNLLEDNLERSVDFGHTFSTMLEMHNVSKLLHGEAVAIDMCLSAMLSFIKGFLSEEDAVRIFTLIARISLPTFNKKLKPQIMWESLQDRTLHRDGLQRVPLPTKIGEVIFSNDITYNELCNAITLLKNLTKEFKHANRRKHVL